MTQEFTAPEKHLNTSPSRLARHPLVSYFVLAYAMAWLLWLPFLLSKGGGLGLISFTTEATTPPGLKASALIILGSFGPAIASVLMTARTQGKAGVALLFRRIVHVRVGFQWYLIAIFFPLISLLPMLATPAQFSRVFSGQGGIALMAYVVSVPIDMVLGTPLGEEIGWRGFVLPRLQQRMGPFKGTLLLGMLWGLWHAPLAFFTIWGLSFQREGIAAGFLLYILLVISYSVIMTWLFNQTRGSLFLAIMFHSAVDTALVPVLILFPQSSANAMHASGPTLLVGTSMTAALWVVTAGIVLIATKGKLSYQPSIEQEVYPSPAPSAL
jgi:membrane protease YdiL (CAAX protease family)